MCEPWNSHIAKCRLLVPREVSSWGGEKSASLETVGSISVQSGSYLDSSLDTVVYVE